MEVDLIIQNVKVFNAYLKKFIDSDIAVLEGKFLYIGKESIDKLSTKKIIDGKDKYMISGLIDIHMHIESSMTTPFQFSQAAIRHGVTTIVTDPHEIANVFGIEGIEAMINMSTHNTVDIFYGIPSSVPSTSTLFETTGGKIETKEVSTLLELDKVCCLGEVMNFKDLLKDDDSSINQIIKEVKNRKPHLRIEGHCPKITGLDLARFIYKGVDADHTQQTVETLKEKIQNGMFIEIQDKSMTKENIKYLVENNLYEHFCLVTDDVMADELVEGHLNKLVMKAISMGMPAEMAIYVSTYTPARRMLMDDRGSIAPGKRADFILLEDVKDFKIDSVYKEGECVFNGNRQFRDSNENFPKHFYESINLDYLLESDFEIEAPIKEGKSTCRIIEVKSNTTFTEEKQDSINVRNSKLQWQSSPYSLIAVFERYNKSGNKAFGLVTGSIIKEGAVATTYAHDHHNLMVLGKNSGDMTIAANWVIKNQGGYCVVKDGKILASIELPIGGILSESRIDILGSKLKNVRESLQKLGYKHHNEIMSFSTLSLPVSPNLKITDKGLINVKKQEIVSLFC